MSDDLAAFLLARLAEVEADQRDKRKRWHRGGCSAFDYDASYDSCDCGLDVRVLADVEAKRRIIELHQPRGVQGGPPYRWTCKLCDHAPVPWDSYGEWPCRTMRALALPYADHPDYQPGWAPPTEETS